MKAARPSWVATLVVALAVVALTVSGAMRLRASVTPKPSPSAPSTPR